MGRIGPIVVNRTDLVVAPLGPADISAKSVVADAVQGGEQMTLRKTNPIQRRKKRTEDGNSVVNYCLICLGLSYISFVSFEIQTTEQ